MLLWCLWALECVGLLQYPPASAVPKARPMSWDSMANRRSRCSWSLRVKRRSKSSVDAEKEMGGRCMGIAAARVQAQHARELPAGSSNAVQQGQCAQQATHGPVRRPAGSWQSPRSRGLRTPQRTCRIAGRGGGGTKLSAHKLAHLRLTDWGCWGCANAGAPTVKPCWAIRRKAAQAPRVSLPA